MYETQKIRQAYIPPVVKTSNVTEDWDKFWLAFETKQQDEKKETNAEIQQLEECVSRFLNDANQSCLLLLADAGTGKSLGLHQLTEQLLSQSSTISSLQHNIKNNLKDDWLPVFIRPALQQKWSYSSLTNAIQSCLSFYQLSIQQQQALQQQQTTKKTIIFT